MSDWSEPVVRACAFIATFAVLAVAERLRHFRVPQRRGRWATNAALFAADTLIVRLIPGGSLIALATFVDAKGIGALALVHWPAPLEVALAVVALDASVYWQHRLFHRIAWLWRFHRVHHSDVEFDVTTAIRFHPGEILASLALKAATIVLLGAGPLAVLVFETLLNSAALFTHSNFALPPSLDRICRWAIVTPSMHRVHHSTEGDEHNRNFGFLIVWWDRCFGSYRAESRGAPDTMDMGLTAFRIAEDQTFPALLRQPLANAR